MCFNTWISFRGKNGKGSTIYYDGLSKKMPGQKIYEVPFIHGQIQITTFCDVVHGTNCFQDKRYTINVNIKYGIQKKI